MLNKQIKNYSKFYQKVWKVVLQIPRGEVRSYSWVAEKVGSPRAYRAVGQALKNNPFPACPPRPAFQSPDFIGTADRRSDGRVIIPCHRVIRKDGGIGGYSGGIARKYELLKKENKDLVLRKD